MSDLRPADPARRSTWTRRRAREILRFEGVAGYWFRLLAFFGYRREGWFERALDQPIEDVVPKVPVVLRELLPAEAEAYLRFRPGATIELFSARIARGCRCHVAEQKGRILAATWVQEGKGFVEHLGRTLELSEDAVYLFNSYTDPTVRGARLHGALAAAILREYRNRGFRKAITMVEPHNHSGVRSRRRSGFRRTGTLIRIELGPWHKELSRGRTEDRAPSETTAREAPIER